MTSLFDALALTPAESSGDVAAAWTVQLHQDWTQGRTQFGGLLAGQMASASVRLAGPERSLRTMDVAFIGTLAPGTAELEVRVLGEGKAVSQYEVRISQAGVPATRAHVVVGAPRVSPLRVPGPQPRRLTEDFADPEQAGIEFPYLEGITPVFSKHMALRWCGPSFPFSGAPPEEARLAGWCRWRDEPPSEVDEATALGAYVALLDAWPPTVLPITPGPTAVSTIRWGLHLLAPLPPAATSRWSWYEGETLAHGDGYSTSTDTFWLDGIPVAWTEQLIAVYDKPAPPPPGEETAS